MSLSVVGLDPAGAFYARLVESGQAVLVLGAADALVACAVATRGGEVVAVEPSTRLLALAIERREAQARGAGLRFEQADLRAVRLGRAFPLVLAPQNALALMRGEGEVAAFVATLAAHLAPGGRFALDLRLPRGDAQRLGRPHLRARGGGAHRLHQPELAADALQAELLAAGLRVDERYGDFAGTPAREGDELRVLVGRGR